MKIKDVFNLFIASFNGGIEASINNPETTIESLETDSRNHFNPATALFFAIQTPGGNDGHNYINQLYLRGVRNFVVEDLPDLSKYPGSNFIKTPNSIKALAYLGKAHRNNAGQVVAISGSRGKTTVKEMIFQMMEPFKKISRSPRSYNSKIGVPLSLWQIKPDTDVAIIEAGISKRGEMDSLRDLIDPEIVIFTNIGDAHSQGFDSYREKTLEKAKLAGGKNVRTVIYPYDDLNLREILKSSDKEKKVVRWSLKNPEVELYVKYIEGLLTYSWEGNQYTFPVKIEKPFDLENVVTTLAFMLVEGIEHSEIAKRFKNLHHIGTRLNVSEGINGCSVILDSYTSDLSSLAPAIDFMNRRKNPGQSPVLIMSDLHHEAGNVEDLYLEMAKMVKDTQISRFIGIGEKLLKYSGFFPSHSKFFKDTASFLSEINATDFNDEIILLKGGPEFNFEKIHELLEAKKHETVLEVNLDALLKNYNYFRSKIPSTTGIIAMVKASGYGAGSYEIAKTLQDAGASYLAVAALDEGIDLRKNGIEMPVMVMNPRAANYRALFINRLEPVIYSLSMLESLIEASERHLQGVYPVHIKLDTGMHRMGFLPDELDRVIEMLSTSQHIKVASIFSHLATADCLDMDEFTMTQLHRFEVMSGKLIDGLGYDVKRHILNSAGILRFPEYHYDLVRLGIGLYGAETLPRDIEAPLATVSTLRTVIICIREIENGEAVGYSRKGKINKKSRIATIPIGYADGMNRRFGNGAISVIVNGQKVPTIGNICMDATMIDVTGIDCKEGDSVEIFGENMSVQALADTLGTIPYEILTSVSPRVKRIYFRE